MNQSPLITAMLEAELADRTKALNARIAELEALAAEAGAALKMAHSRLDAAMGDGDCYITDGLEAEHMKECPFCTINAILTKLAAAGLMPGRKEE